MVEDKLIEASDDRTAANAASPMEYPRVPMGYRYGLEYDAAANQASYLADSIAERLVSDGSMQKASADWIAVSTALLSFGDVLSIQSRAH
jgi:hypothetical protein